jgi:hypothetical protein
VRPAKQAHELGAILIILAVGGPGEEEVLYYIRIDGYCWDVARMVKETPKGCLTLF